MTAFKRIKFTDGYIEIRPEGNTYFGNIANELAFIARKLERGTGIEFEKALDITLKSYEQKDKI